MNPWMHVAGWVLVHFVWQGAALALVAAVVLRLCHRQSASARYAVACGALAAMLVSAGITAALVEAPAAGVEAKTVSARTAPNDRGSALLPIQVHEAPSPAAVSTAQRVEALLPWIVSVWMFGVIVLLARAGAGWWRVRSLHQLALRTIGSSWQAAGNRLASRLGLDRVIRVVELPHIDVPLVVGCLRPIVVLPIAAISQLSTTQVEAILAHELAHVRRHDYLVNLMQTLAETLLFYHPAVWWLSARIRDEREHCCDDVAVAVCGDPVGYAAALAELESWRSGEMTLAAAATGGSLLNRVRRILRVEVSDDLRMSSWTIGLVAAATVGGLAVNVIAQTTAPAEPRPAFEVASVRLNTSGTNQVSMSTQPGGRYTTVNVPLAMLIRSAYRLQESQLVGAPDWVMTERYDIAAKAEGEFGPPVPGGGPGRQQLMLQSLLEERFKLKPRRETRQLPIFALVLAQKGKFGPALTPSTVDCQALAAARKQGAAPPAPPKPGERPQCGTHMGFGRIAGGMPMSSLARLLSDVVQRSVVDSTGLTGNFDLELSFTPDQLPSRPGTPADQPFRMNGVEIDPNGPSIFTALQEQLGLKLDAARGPVDVLVIDHIERPSPD